MLCLVLPPCPKVQKLDLQSEFSCQKSPESFRLFFSLKKRSLGAHLLVKWFFGNINLKTTFFTKIKPDFGQGGKARHSILGHLSLGRMANLVRPFWQIGLPNVSLLRLMTLGLPTPPYSLKITLSLAFPRLWKINLLSKSRAKNSVNCLIHDIGNRFLDYVDSFFISQWVSEVRANVIVHLA